MSLIRSLARPLLASTFLVRGIDTMMHPMSRAQLAAPLTDQLNQRTSMSADPELVVRVHGAVMTGAALLLATGRLPRLSSAVLAVGSVPSTLVDHPFWDIKDPERRRDERGLFLRDMSLVGGLMLASVDLEGKPGLAWRGEHAMQDAEKGVERAKRMARLVGNQASWAGRLLGKEAKLEARSAALNVRSTANQIGNKAAKALPSR